MPFELDPILYPVSSAFDAMAAAVALVLAVFLLLRRNAAAPKKNQNVGSIDT